MKLVFKNKFIGYTEKDIEITLNIGTLEAVCKALGIDFNDISETIKSKNYDFTVQLLYQGYITACKDRYKKPKYNLFHAVLWNEKMSKEASVEFAAKMTELFGEIAKTTKKKVLTKVQK